MRDYGKVHTSFWTSANIRALSEDGRTLALYLLTCPHGTIAGVFRLPDGYACEDLQWDASRVSVTLSELFDNGFATRCEGTKWVWVAKHFEWNPPENPNQRKAVAKMVNQIPDSCSWKQEFIGKCWNFLGLEPIEQEPLRNPSETLPQPVTVTVTVTEEIPSLSSAAPPTPKSPVEPKKPKPPAIPDCPHDSLIDLFAERLPELAQPVRSLWADGKNAPAAKARWIWVLTASHESGSRKGKRLAENAEEALAWFDRYFTYVSKSDFLTGRDGEWAADLGWLLTKGNFEKVISGCYENKARAA